MPTVQPFADRAEVAAILGATGDVSGSGIAGPAETIRPGYVPLPQRRRSARRASGRLHGDRHRLPFGENAGQDVLHPMGFDAFGLPAEEHAIKTNTPPRVQTERNIDNFRRQLKMLGFSYDWQRELATTDVDYFRWTQWIFLVLFDTWFDPRAAEGTSDRGAADSRRGRRGRGSGRSSLPG